MWKYHLTELKNDNQMFTNSELPKGRLQIKGNLVQHVGL